jgi:hypothetical protein
MPRLTQSHPMGPFCTGGRRGRSQQRDRVSAKRLDLGLLQIKRTGVDQAPTVEGWREERE